MNYIPVFSISPNPTMMYMTPVLKSGVARIKRAIERKQGLAAILGEPGLGKSTLLRWISSNYDLDEEHYAISYLHDSRQCRSPFDLLKVMGEDFGISPKRSQRAQMRAIEEYLLANYEAQKTTVVFIDEAQRFPLESLELLRSLLNFETDTHKLLQVVVAGQIELRDRLLKKGYEALRSRIVAPLLLQPLALEETKQMINSRLESWEIDNPFQSEALTEIYSLSGGVPREILLLCQGAYDLATGPDGRVRSVNAGDVQEAQQALALDSPKETAQQLTYEPVS